ncbi:hypothetical protein E2C01_095783 [Portunus trituberculatus]|uniref:Uncharacterized protein n=1 Tax=Portunus trituberculatus TaxID=210409 RepID=A0A5B7K548_PORTR|nr:hypothetical protein [Portunus trituberculatus]
MHHSGQSDVVCLFSFDGHTDLRRGAMGVAHYPIGWGVAPPDPNVSFPCMQVGPLMRSSTLSFQLSEAGHVKLGAAAIISLGPSWRVEVGCHPSSLVVEGIRRPMRCPSCW